MKGSVSKKDLFLRFDESGRIKHDKTLLASSAHVDSTGSLQGRLLAGLLDLSLLCGIDAAVLHFTTKLVGLPLAASVIRLPLAPLAAFLIVFDVGYVVALTAVGGQTIGKMALGLRVEGSNGDPVAPLRALIRTAAYAISVVPLGVGFVSIFLRSGRTLHDLVADTRVVRFP